MIVSYKWLQKYFEKDLPSPEDLARILTMKVFEVESVEEKGEDVVLDVKVLPDRARYCLSHRGVASEIGAATGVSLNETETETIEVAPDLGKIEVSIEDIFQCDRYSARLLENVSVSESPEWLREKLEVIGQHSINSIVDAANYVMFDMGQPLHAFDADKVVGGIIVRKAHEGEHITTLDGREVSLAQGTLVIADEEGPLAIAGIKGGTRAAVSNDTKRVILEAAHFHAGSIRQTSSSINIRTDASKRFENDITPEYAGGAMEELTSLLVKLSPDVRVGPVTDIYPSPREKNHIDIDVKEIDRMLGISVPKEEAIRILGKLGIEIDEKGEVLSLTIPFERGDLAIPEDIVEEVGRLYGYEKLRDDLPPLGVVPVLHKEHYYVEKVRDIMAGLGFSEVYLYTLVSEGEYETVIPLAADKAFLRTDLSSGLQKALKENSRNAPLFGTDVVKIFECGRVFPKEGERLSFAFGIENAPGSKADDLQKTLDSTIDEILNKLGLSDKLRESFERKGNVAEIPFDVLLEALPDVEDANPDYQGATTVFEQFSQFPFVLRDVAVWVPEGVKASEAKEIISQEAGEWMQVIRLVDEYPKDGRVSYAFRLVFQSKEKTLTDEEVGEVMERVYSKLSEQADWEIR